MEGDVKLEHFPQKKINFIEKKISLLRFIFAH